MSTRSEVLFVDGRPTPFMRSQWVAKGAAQPLLATQHLEQDRSAKRTFRGLWDRAFPDRDSLPFGALVDPEGRATDPFWNVWG